MFTCDECHTVQHRDELLPYTDWNGEPGLGCCYHCHGVELTEDVDLWVEGRRNIDKLLSNLTVIEEKSL